MKNILILFFGLYSSFLFGQKISPYQKTQQRVAIYYANKYNLNYKTLLSVAEVNTNGGKNGFIKINNPFKIKCFSTKCKEGHCTNTDKKNHKEFYRIYPNVRESYDAYCRMKILRNQ